MYRYLYMDIAVALGGDLSGLGSDEHMQTTWNRIRGCPLFENKTCIMRLGRWFQHERKASTFSPWAPVMLLVLLHMGLETGWWKHISETPLFNKEACIELLADTPDATGELPSDDGGTARFDPDAPLPKTMQESNEELERKRKSANGNLHFAALFLSRSRENRLWRASVALAEPFSEQHGREVVMSTTKGACRSCIAVGLGKGMRRLATRSLVFSLPQHSLSKCGLPVPWRNSIYRRKGASFQSMCSSSCILVFSRLLSGFQYTSALPYFFARLLHNDGEKVREALSDIRQWSIVLEGLERDAVRRPEVRSLVSSLLWPRFTWVREQLVRLSEDGFGTVGPLVRGEVQYFVNALLTTRPVELAFNSLRDRIRYHKAKQMGEEAKWHETEHHDPRGARSPPACPHCDSARHCADEVAGQPLRWRQVGQLQHGEGYLEHARPRPGAMADSDATGRAVSGVGVAERLAGAGRPGGAREAVLGVARRPWYGLAWPGAAGFARPFGCDPICNWAWYSSDSVRDRVYTWRANRLETTGKLNRLRGRWNTPLGICVKVMLCEVGL